MQVSGLSVAVCFSMACAGGAAAQEVVATIGGLSGAQEVAVDEATNRVYVSLPEGLGVFDGATNTRITTVPAGLGPWGVALNPLTGRIYVTNQVGGGVTVVDSATLAVVRTINPSARASTPLVDVAHNRIYVGQELTTLIWVIDGATDTQLGTIDTGVYRPAWMILDDHTGLLYVANNGGGPLLVIDTADNAVVRSYPLSHGSHFAIDRVHNRLYFAELSDRVDVIDLGTGAVSFFTVDPSPLSYDPLLGIGYNPSTNHLFVSRGMSHTMVMLDGDTFAPLATIRSGNDGIAVNDATNMVYVAERGEIVPGDPPAPGHLWAIRDSPSLLRVACDIKPGDATNAINLKSAGTLPAAILGSAVFDAASIDDSSVTLAGAPALRASLEDVNGDGRRDLVIHVSTRALQLTGASTEAVLRGRTFGGARIEGRDAVRIVH